MTNKHECQKRLSSRLREAAGSKSCVDPRNRQQIGVGGAKRTCRDGGRIASALAEVSSVVDHVSSTVFRTLQLS